MEYRECGPVCPNTCTSYRTGINPCFSLRCAPAGCYCANDNILVNGQCLPPAVACQGKSIGIIINNNYYSVGCTVICFNLHYVKLI